MEQCSLTKPENKPKSKLMALKDRFYHHNIKQKTAHHIQHNVTIVPNHTVQINNNENKHGINKCLNNIVDNKKDYKNDDNQQNFAVQSKSAEKPDRLETGNAAKKIDISNALNNYTINYDVNKNNNENVNSNNNTDVKLNSYKLKGGPDKKGYASNIPHTRKEIDLSFETKQTLNISTDSPSVALKQYIKDTDQMVSFQENCERSNLQHVQQVRKQLQHVRQQVYNSDDQKLHKHPPTLQQVVNCHQELFNSTNNHHQENKINNEDLICNNDYVNNCIINVSSNFDKDINKKKECNKLQRLFLHKKPSIDSTIDNQQQNKHNNSKTSRTIISAFKFQRKSASNSPMKETSSLYSPLNHPKDLDQPDFDSQLHNSSLYANFSISSEAQKMISTDALKLEKSKTNLPLVESANKSGEQPLGLVFLTFREETKRSMLPNEITSLSTIWALFVRAFPDHLSMSWFEMTRVTIYIRNPSTKLYSPMKNLKEIKDRSALKVFEEEALMRSKIIRGHPSLISSATNQAWRRVTNMRLSNRSHDEISNIQSQERHFLSPQMDMHPSITNRNDVIRSAPPVNRESRIPSNSCRLEKNYPPLSYQRQQRQLRPQQIHKQQQLQQLLQQQELASQHSHQILPQIINVNTRQNSQQNSISANSDLSQSTVVKNPISTTPSICQQKNSNESNNSETVHSTNSNAIDLEIKKKMIILKTQTKALQEDLQQLKHLQLLHISIMKNAFKVALRKYQELIGNDLLVRPSPNDEGQIKNFENCGYENDVYLVESKLRELEGSVEDLKNDVVKHRRKIIILDINKMTYLLGNVAKMLNELKRRLLILQTNSRPLIVAKVGAFIQDDKLLKDERNRLESLLSRCKLLAATLSTLKKLALIQENAFTSSSEHSGHFKLSPTKLSMNSNNVLQPTNLNQQSSYISYGNTSLPHLFNFNYLNNENPSATSSVTSPTPMQIQHFSTSFKLGYKEPNESPLIINEKDNKLIPNNLNYYNPSMENNKETNMVNCNLMGIDISHYQYETQSAPCTPLLSAGKPQQKLYIDEPQIEKENLNDVYSLVDISGSDSSLGTCSSSGSSHKIFSHVPIKKDNLPIKMLYLHDEANQCLTTKIYPQNIVLNKDNKNENKHKNIDSNYNISFECASQVKPNVLYDKNISTLEHLKTEICSSLELPKHATLRRAGVLEPPTVDNNCNNVNKIYDLTLKSRDSVIEQFQYCPYCHEDNEDNISDHKDNLIKHKSDCPYQVHETIMRLSKNVGQGCELETGLCAKLSKSHLRDRLKQKQEQLTIQQHKNNFYS